MPAMMWGIGSEVAPSTETSAVSGSIRRAWRTTTVPRSKGPALAAVIETNERLGSRGRGRPGRPCRGRR